MVIDYEGCMHAEGSFEYCFHPNHNQRDNDTMFEHNDSVADKELNDFVWQTWERQKFQFNNTIN
jgi:hypothetical protein